MKKGLTLKAKITIGIIAFVLTMAILCWVIALALKDTDIKTEVYNTQFDYVGDMMIDNTYVGMSAGGWKLYQGNSAISRKFGYLSYAGDGMFSFQDNNGNWGYVSTSGFITREYGSDFKLFNSADIHGIAVKTDKGTVNVRSEGNKRYAFEGDLVPYKDASALYDGLSGNILILKEENGFAAYDYIAEKKTQLPIKNLVDVQWSEGFALASENGHSYVFDKNLSEIKELQDVKPTPDSAVLSDGLYYGLADGRQVIFDKSGSDLTVKSGGYIYTTAVDASISGAQLKVLKVAGRNILTSGLFLSGGKVYHARESEVKGDGVFMVDGVHELNGKKIPVVHVTETGGSSFYVLMDAQTATKFKEIRPVTINSMLEKNRIEYVSKQELLLIDGNLCDLDESGKFEILLTNVEKIEDAEKESFIIRRTSEGFELYDSKLKLKSSLKTTDASAKIISAKYQIYSAVDANGKNVVATPRGKIEVADSEKIVLYQCLNGKDIFIGDEVNGNIYDYNGNLLGKTSPTDRIVMTDNTIAVIGENTVRVLNKNKTADFSYGKDEGSLMITKNSQFAVGLSGKELTVVNLINGNVTEHKTFSSELALTAAGESEVVFKDNGTELYGIISDGRISLYPTYQSIELWDDCAIVSVDSKSYVQADFAGKRQGDVYKEIKKAGGLIFGEDFSSTTVILNARGRVVLKNVVAGSQTEMSSYAFDEATLQTVAAVRKDGSSLVKVTAGGYIRLISVSKKG